MVVAILLEVTSIQSYIFNSNKLKENLGASYLVKDIFDKHIIESASATFSGTKIIWDAWKKKPYVSVLLDKQPFDVGYMGGGNALLFFNKKSDATLFIKHWTTQLLVKAPGIQTAVAVDDNFDISDNGFELSKNNLFKQLAKNKSRFIPQTIISRHGITAECQSTGYSMEIWNEKAPIENRDYVSSVTYAKVANSKPFKSKIKDQFISPGFDFPDDIEKMGQKENESNRIAIVHIDGNEMGKKFKHTKTLSEIRMLSVSLQKATDNAFQYLVNTIQKEFDILMDELGNNTTKPNEQTKTLPIIPIIIGGDDITFMCPGKFGIYYSELFLQNFKQQKVEIRNNDFFHPEACAGISIVKSKYPFYKAYSFAEELCKSAKRYSREDNGSWVDFHISYGGLTTSLKNIRQKEYVASQGNLLNRPYKLGGILDKSYENWLLNTAKLQWKLNSEGKIIINIPRSKIKEIRKNLMLGKFSTTELMRSLKIQGFKPDLFENVGEMSNFFESKKTLFFDMIELLEFYPEYKLIEKLKEAK